MAGAVVLAQEGPVLSEGCQRMANGEYDRQFPPHGPVLICTTCSVPFFDGEDILITVTDLDGDPSTEHNADILFVTPRFWGGGEAAYSTSGSVNQQTPLRLVILDVVGGDYWNGVVASSSDAPPLSLQLTATCGNDITPTERQQCEDWTAFGFDNRGACIRSTVGQPGGG
jgi:hypothetical protein